MSVSQEQAFREVVELVYGEGANELIRKMDDISKMNPDQADLHGAAAAASAGKKDRRKRAVTAGLSAIGATAGAAGLGYAGYKTGQAYKTAKGATRLKRLGTAVKHEKFGAALLPLEVAGLGGEVMATRILHGDTKHKTIQKNEIPEASGIPTSRGQLTRMVATNSAKAGGKGLEFTAGQAKKLPERITTTKGRLARVKEKLSKDLDVVWDAEISKLNEDKQQIFGWASVIEVNGEPVVDLQGDYISPEEMEKSAYEYVVKSRKGGDMHLRNEWEPIHKSDMIESFIVTPEKRQAMGIPDTVPTGWWVGYQINDPEHWADIKSGKRTGFSIHGRGRRTPA